MAPLPKYVIFPKFQPFRLLRRLQLQPLVHRGNVSPKRVSLLGEGMRVQSKTALKKEFFLDRIYLLRCRCFIPHHGEQLKGPQDGVIPRVRGAEWRVSEDIERILAGFQCTGYHFCFHRCLFGLHHPGSIGTGGGSMSSSPFIHGVPALTARGMGHESEVAVMIFFAKIVARDAETPIVESDCRVRIPGSCAIADLLAAILHVTRLLAMTQIGRYRFLHFGAILSVRRIFLVGLSEPVLRKCPLLVDPPRHLLMSILDHSDRIILIHHRASEKSQITIRPQNTRF
jgi:hypothetical protein